MRYTVVGNIEQPEYSHISDHRTLRGAGRAYQAGRRGNLCRVIDNVTGDDVTSDACDAANEETA